MKKNPEHIELNEIGLDKDRRELAFKLIPGVLALFANQAHASMQDPHKVGLTKVKVVDYVKGLSDHAVEAGLNEEGVNKEGLEVGRRKRWIAQIARVVADLKLKK